jgi:ATP-dependent helicase/nuclease subunit B
MSRSVEFLSRFCAQHRLENKHLIVPSYAVGHQLGEALTKEGGSWINLHYATLPSLARKTAAFALSARDTKLVSQSNALFLIDRVFRRLKAGKKLKYFGRVEATTGIVQAIRRSIFALRMAGWGSRGLKPNLFISDTKGEEIILMLREYEEDLEKEKLTDLPGLYILALKEVKKAQKKTAPIPEAEFYLYLQGRPLEYLEAEFLKTLAGGNLVPVPSEPVYGLRPPPLLGLDAPLAPPAPPAAGPAPKTDAERLPWLFATAKAPPPVRDNTIDIFSAIGPANECREILRRLVAEKTALDDVEIIHPPDSTYPSIMYALAAKSGLPMTYAEGIPLAFTAPGKAFNGLVEWLEHDYLVSDLCALIEAGVLKLPSGNGHVALTPLKASRYLKSAMIGWGRERYVVRLQTLIRDADESVRASEVEGEIERVEKYRENIREVESLVALIKDIMELVPGEVEGGKVDFAALCLGTASFVGKFAAIFGDLDAEARGLLQSRLDEAAAFKTAPLKRQAALEWLKDLAAGLRVGASGPAPGHLHLSSWRAGGFSGRPVTFVTGLDQGNFPGAGIQDPILLDEERERLNEVRKAPLLRTTAESLRQSLWGMAAMLARLRGRLTLSYSAFDIIEERQSFPSSIVLQAARLGEGKPELDYSGLAKLIEERGGGARGFLPETRVLDETDWWLGKLAPGGMLRDGMEAVKSNFDLLGRGIFGLERRERAAVGEFEGKIKIDPKEVHPLHNKDIMLSASRLEKLAKCPFGYLMRYVLEVRPPDELELDQSQWLNPLLRGTLLHDIFAEFMRELRSEREKRKGAERAKAKVEVKRRGETGEGPAVRALQHGPLMRRITDEMIERYKEEIPPPSEAVFEQERKEIEEAAAIFLKAEEERESAGEPLLFEVSFGTGRRLVKKAARAGEKKGTVGNGETKEKELREEEDHGAYEVESEERMEEPAVLNLGEGRSVPIAGRIDRIDRLEDGRYRVIDYKTGSYKIYDDLDMFGKGRILQHALYAVAAEQILKKLGIDERAVVAESGYYFPTRKGEGNWVKPKLDRQKFNELVVELIGIIERGHFVANPGLSDIDCEQFCDYGRICGGASARERAKEKKDRNPDVFAIFDRLKDYE